MSEPAFGIDRRSRLVAADDLEGQRLQGVAREDGCGFVELAVAGRPAAAQVVVVHGRQVVVDQRVGVDHFHRACQPVERLRRTPTAAPAA